MAANKADIADWFREGVKRKATHMIVVCDTFDYEDYPIFVTAAQDVHEVEKEKNDGDMQRVMEVYNLNQPMLPQLNGVLVRNY